MDMEFVLGSCATKALTRFPYAMENFDHQETLDIPPRDFKPRSIHLWMLNFDKANRIEMTKDDVDKKLLPAFLGNDPYYPRPATEKDNYLWEEFSEVYPKASGLILKRRGASKSVMELPARFLRKVEERVKENAKFNLDDTITFG